MFILSQLDTCDRTDSQNIRVLEKQYEPLLTAFISIFYHIIDTDIMYVVEIRVRKNKHSFILQSQLAC